MSTLTLPNPTFTPDTTADATKVTANNTAITTWANGNIDNSNIAANAGIALSKLSLTGVVLNKGTTGTNTWGSGLTTDTQPRVTQTTDKGLRFGPGSTTPPDVELIRSATKTLQLNDTSGGAATLDMNNGSIINFSLGTTVNVAGGGTGATTLASGAYLKGAGTSPITTQATPIPVADGGTGTALFTSGTATFSTANAVDVTDATITSNSIIIVTVKGSAVAEEFSYTLSAGVKFTIHSTNASSTATVGWIRIG